MAKTKVSTMKHRASAPVQPTPYNRAAIEPRELTDTQALVCDLIGDMVLNGCHPDDLLSLLRAAVTHNTRRDYALWQSRWELDQPSIDRDATRWQKGIMRTWPERKPATKEQPAVTFSDRARQLPRDLVLDHMRYFAVRATPEEVRLMEVVLRDWRSNSSGPDILCAEVALATAMGEQIQDARHYLKVAPRHRGLVEQYIDILEKSECGETRSA